MPQDAASGGDAARWGRETAAKIGRLLGARMDGPGNEGTLDGRRCSIKCLRASTGTMNVNRSTLDRVAVVIATLQNVDGTYSLHAVEPDWLLAKSTPATAGSGRGRAVKISRRTLSSTPTMRIVTTDELART